MNERHALQLARFITLVATSRSATNRQQDDINWKMYESFIFCFIFGALTLASFAAPAALSSAWGPCMLLLGTYHTFCALAASSHRVDADLSGWVRVPFTPISSDLHVHAALCACTRIPPHRPCMHSLRMACMYLDLEPCLPGCRYGGIVASSAYSM